jgi:hypothetical protein
MTLRSSVIDVDVGDARREPQPLQNFESSGFVVEQTLQRTISSM